MGVSFDAGLDDDDEWEIHEINVTPFIDVMLVLLIIFMVAAPLSTVDLPVDLPSSTAIPMKKPDKPIYITIKADLVVAVGETSDQEELISSALSMAWRKGTSNASSFAPTAVCPTES